MKLNFKNLTILSTVLTTTFLVGCADKNDKKDLTSQPINEKTVPAKKKKSSVSMFKVGNELFSIPSPVQTSVMLKKSGSTYDKSLLNDPKKVSSYSTKVQKALNLGVYGTDLGYTTIYDQNQDLISYFNATKRVADELGIADAFDQRLVARFEANMGNQDSLLAMVSDAYRTSDQFLKNNDQDDIGAFILCGGYIEALHFSTVIATASNNQDVINRIAEQKGSLENLIKLTQKYSNTEKTDDLIEDLIELYDIFNEIEYTYTWVEPTTDEASKTTKINSTVTVNVTPAQLKSITEKVSSIRQSIIG